MTLANQIDQSRVLKRGITFSTMPDLTAICIRPLLQALVSAGLRASGVFNDPTCTSVLCSAKVGPPYLEGNCLYKSFEIWGVEGKNNFLFVDNK